MKAFWSDLRGLGHQRLHLLRAADPGRRGRGPLRHGGGRCGERHPAGRHRRAMAEHDHIGVYIYITLT